MMNDKQMYKGIFWLVDDSLLSVKVPCDPSGTALVPCNYSSKSGENFSHREEWKKIRHPETNRRPYNYYPRGRVEIKNGKTDIWLHPSLSEPGFLSALADVFGLDLSACRIHTDYSDHYRIKTEIQHEEKKGTKAKASLSYKEYVKTIRDVPPPAGLELMQAVIWLHPERLPLGVVSLGKGAKGVIRIPGSAENRFGRVVPVISIAKNAFENQREITDLVLPASIDHFPQGAFAGCKKLERITIPKKIRVIGEGTFAGCTALKDIYYEGSPEDWNKIEIEHRKHEIVFGKNLPGSPVQEISEERWMHVPGNEALFSANIHFHCPLEPAFGSLQIILKGKDITGLFRARMVRRGD